MNIYNNYNNKINYICTQSNTTVYFFALLATSFGQYGRHEANVVLNFLIKKKLYFKHNGMSSSKMINI